VKERWPAAVRYIEEHRLNEFFAEGADDIGILVQGGNYNTLVARSSGSASPTSTAARRSRST
jgi:TPP-dependent indolepyruvate ferredoxin oxidoreductase alpha subunit